MMDKQYLIVGNWKMNKTPSQSSAFVQTLIPEVETGNFVEGLSLAICPPFTALDCVAELLKDSKIALGAQNLCAAVEGAFTGEISAAMLRDLRVSYVIIGHSERRTIFQESDALIHQKVKIAQAHGLTPILCVGETLEEREAGRAQAVVQRQITLALESITDPRCVIAYEPVWAIGTGKTATVDIAQAMHAFIRGLLTEQFGKDGSDMHILYGGSMKVNNAAELLAQPDITGGLIGGASLIAEDFIGIAQCAR
ncbi:MAG: triose-phosphate isomerase [Puniceicoccales bacterium]|jgi:triosephosphate isomerase|nr:triose-phosphate isomerase [Puniceicoccales bacterium]